jgi:pyruvate dehydrogenase E2 component (dihydrolipoamide acetyltransferase)
LLKKDGEPVKAGESLFILESDKASQEVEATDSGILRIPPEAPKAGDTVSVGVVLGYLAGADEQGPLSAEASVAAMDRAVPPHPGPGPGARVCDPPPGSVGRRLHGEGEEMQRELPGSRPAETGLVAPQEQAGPAPLASTVTISPRGRRRAAELGVDYRRLKGSGPAGRIVEADVVEAARQNPGSLVSTMRRPIA